MEIVKYKDGCGYIAKCPDYGHKTVKTEKEATLFNNGDAKKFINSKIRKVFRDRLEIIYISDDENINPISATKPIQIINISDTPFNSLDFDWDSKIKSDEKFQNELAEYRRNLPAMLHNIECEICDIEHYIEFYNLNASDGYKAYKMLNEKRRIRRKIKNEMYIVKVVYENWLKKSDFSNIQRAVENIKKRRYTPRALPELFAEEHNL